MSGMLRLYVPKQSNLPGVDTDPDALARWADELPYADAPACAQLVLTRLREINTQKLPPRHRAGLMAAFQQAYNRLHEPLRTAHAEHETGHLVSRELRLLEQLTEQMLYGYKYLILDAQDERATLRKPRHLHGAVAHAAHLIVLLLASRYADYMPTEQRLWKEAAELLEFSELRDVPEWSAEGFPFLERLSAERAFRQLSVLRLSDPFRLPPGRIWDTLAYVSAHLERIRLLPGGADAISDAPGRFPLCRDCEPGERLRIPDTAAGVWRQIELDGLIAAAREHAERLTDEDCPLPPGLSRDRTRREHRQLLVHLLHQWNTAPQRRHERRLFRELTRLRCGLSDTWRLFNGDVPFDPHAWHDEGDEDVWMEPEAEAGTDPAPVRECACTIDNRSAGGLGVRYARQRLALHVGDLVSVAVPHANQGTTWFAALVRWVLNEGCESAAGLQYIARQPLPVAVRPADEEAATPWLPALRCEFTSGDRTALLLIAPRGLYAERRLLDLRWEGGTEQRLCGRLIEVANGIERFSMAD